MSNAQQTAGWLNLNDASLTRACYILHVSLAHVRLVLPTFSAWLMGYQRRFTLHSQMPTEIHAQWDSSRRPERIVTAHPAHALHHITVQYSLFTPFLVCVWPIFHNYSAANSAVRHWAKQFDKLHHRLSDQQNGLDVGHSKLDIVHNFRHLQIVWPMSS